MGTRGGSIRRAKERAKTEQKTAKTASRKRSMADKVAEREQAQRDALAAVKDRPDWGWTDEEVDQTS